MQSSEYATYYWASLRHTWGGYKMAECLNRWIAYFILPGGKICFNTFIAISMWFLVDQSFKANRFVKMWLEVLFYSIATMIVAAVLGSKFMGIEWFSAFLPITGGVQGYAQTYLAFYLVMPFLTKVSKDMTRNQNIFILIILSIFMFIFREMSHLIWSEQSVYCRLVLFIYIFFLMLYVKRYPIKWLENTALMLIVFIAGWLLVFAYYAGTNILPEWASWKYLVPLVKDEGGLLFVVTGLSLFFAFNSIKLKPCKWINMLGGTTFAVLLIHDGHFFRGWTWNLLHTSDWYYSKYYLLWVILCEIVVYGICTMIEIVRRNIIEKPLFKCNWIKELCEKWDSLIAD